MYNLNLFSEVHVALRLNVVILTLRSFPCLIYACVISNFCSCICYIHVAEDIIFNLKFSQSIIH